MKKKLFYFVCTVLFVLGCWFVVPRFIDHRVKKKLDLVRVPVASCDLLPRTVITESDISFIEIPSAYLMESVYKTSEDIVGKITVRNGLIPEGSLFYVSALEEKDRVSDGAVLDLYPGEVLFALETDIVALAANAISAGQIVDVYVTLEDENRKPVTGSLLKNVRILGIKDHKGLNLDDPDSTKVPHVIQLAITDEALPVLQKAYSLGAISYYATDESYHINKNCEVDWNSDILERLDIKKKAIE